MSKTALHCRRGLPGLIFTACALVWLLGACPAGAAADDKVSESLRSNEAGQRQIQSEAQEFAAQLRAMSAEFARNRLKGDEVKTLDLLSAGIGTMSEQDMNRIIDLLRQARTVGDQRAVLQQVAAAYAGQKNLTTEMRALLTSFQKEQAAADVAAALAKLAERQTANLQTGITAAQWSEGKKPDEAQADLKAAMEVQSSEQAALREEARQAASRLQAAARSTADPTAAAKAQEALQKFGPLNASLDQAAKDLQEGHLFKALTNEKAARDAMRQLARELTPLHENTGDELRQAERDMQDMIAQQKEMLAQTDKIKNTPPDADQWAKQQTADPKSGVSQALLQKDQGKKTPEETAKRIRQLFDAETYKNRQQLTTLEAKANDLANRGDEVSQNLKPDAASAAAAVKAAQEKMQDARADLDDQNAASASQNQQAALAQMEQAQQAVHAQIAAQDAARNADRLTQLQTAKQQTQQLAAQQQAASQQQAAQPQAGASNAAQEADLKNKAQALQEKAAQASSPAAAASIQQAANQMQKAANSLGQPNGQPQAQAAEAAATAALQQAGTQLDKDIAQTASALQQLQQVDQALAALEKIIVGQEKVQTDTSAFSARVAAATNGGNPVERTANPAHLASLQADLKAGTAAVALGLNTPEIKPAADPLNGAESQMENSRTALLKGNAAAALDPQRFAMTDLLQAKELLNAKKAELTQQTDPAAAAAAQDQQAAQLASQIAQAQVQAQAAQDQIAQAQNASNPAQSQSQAGQQQSSPQQGQQPSGQQTAQNSSASPPAPPVPASPQLQNAEHSLDNAANLTGQAAANNSAGPMSDALKQSLAEAQQALNQAAGAAAKGDQATAHTQTEKAQQALAQAQGQAQAAQSGLAQADSSGSLPPAGEPSPAGPPGAAPPAAKGSKPSAGTGPEPAQAPDGGSDIPRDLSQIGKGSLETGSRAPAKGGSAFAKLPARDRAALQQSQAEKYPQEYGSMIEQYMQSLSDQPGS